MDSQTLAKSSQEAMTSSASKKKKKEAEEEAWPIVALKHIFKKRIYNFNAPVSRMAQPV